MFGEVLEFVFPLVIGKLQNSLDICLQQEVVAVKFILKLISLVIRYLFAAYSKVFKKHIWVIYLTGKLIYCYYWCFSSKH